MSFRGVVERQLCGRRASVRILAFALRPVIEAIKVSLRPDNRFSKASGTQQSSAAPLLKPNEPGDKISSSVTPGNAVCPNLWDQAYTELRKADVKLIIRFKNILLSKDTSEENAISKEDRYRKIIDDHLKSMTDHRWILKLCGHSLDIRKQVDRLIKVIQITKDSLTVIAGVEPIYAGLPIAAILLLTPVSYSPINRCSQS